MNQDERTKQTETTLAALQVAVGHLRSSNRGLDASSVRAALKYAERALSGCQQLEAALPQNTLPKSYG